MKRDFERVAIVNRGEAAMRFINAVREFNQERGTRLVTVALYTEPDRRAMFVREADEAVSLGAASFVDPTDGRRRSSYLDTGRLERAFAAGAVDAVWPGWGFVSEDAAFAELCGRLGLVFIGPPPEAMRLLGDKVSAKRLADRARVPVVPWSGAPVETLAMARESAERLGYPLMMKAAAGGGGRGIRRVDSAAGLADAFDAARGEALLSFGLDTVFLEKLLEGVRHVEVQVLADDHGTTWAVGVRDCTLQRRNQKVLEESPAPSLAPGLDRALREAAVRLTRLAGYRNAGTVEFLFDPRGQTFSFLEVNARLQVEHPVTEATTGLDLVKLQIHVARGGRLEGEPPAPVGHAIEVRLNAEDPDADFAPAPGTFALFRLPTGPGMRIDRGVTEGDSVAAEFDPMVAKVIAHGRTRDEALARLRRALSESAIVLDGGTTNKAFLLELLDRPEVRSGDFDTGWLERVTAVSRKGLRRHAGAALVMAALEVYEAELALEESRFYASAARMRPEAREEVGRAVELRHRGQSYGLRVFRLGPSDYRVEVDGGRIDAKLVPLSRFERWLTIGGRRHRVVSVVQGLHHLVEVDGVPHRFSRDDLGILRATSPAVVVSLAVRPGDEVKAGGRIAVLEAMKMEMPLLAPFAGRVRDVLVVPNVQVGPGVALVRLDPAEREEGEPAAERIALPPETGPGETGASVPGRERVLSTLDEIRHLVLGFDTDPAEARRLVSELGATASAEVDDAARREAEDQILSAFADISSLFRRRSGATDGVEETVSTGEYFLTYLRTLAGQTASLPDRFFDRLRLAVAHYGVTDLAPSPALRQALLWIWKSHQRVDQQVEPVLAILERRLLAPAPPGARDDPRHRELLDRLVEAAESRFPSLSDLAREVRYRTFEKPVFEARRTEVYAEVERVLAQLCTDPSSPSRAGRIQLLVDCPQPLHGLLSGRFDGAPAAARALYLEVLTRRYYRFGHLSGFESVRLGEQVAATATHEGDGTRVLVVSSWCLDSDLAESVARLRPLLESAPAGVEVAVDVYAWRRGPLGEAERNAARIRDLLSGISFGRPLRRIVVALAGPGQGPGLGGMQHLTFRPGPDGELAEDLLYRGLHPMVGKRFNIWRLSNFHVERLPSVEDVYLFRVVAKDNPKDERLIAEAEVRDLTPVRDASGRVVQLPYLERMLLEAVDAIRQVQAHRKPEARLQWNRIWLDVWPELDLSLSELDALARKMAPLTTGLGLERVSIRARMRHPQTGERGDWVVSIDSPSESGLVVSVARPSTQPMRSLSEYEQKVVRLRQRGLTYPYEIVRMLAPPRDAAGADFPPGDFLEYDLDEEDELVPVDRPFGKNDANVVVGLLRSFTPRIPEGMTRVVLLGDPTGAMGSLAEPECRRILAALDLAERLRVPLEWYALSAGARIAMESGTENMDWISRVLRRLIEYTQGGGEVNVVVCGINVGAQPYWNAEATMLMHTRGILVMTPESAMVLTGKTALDYSGSVSAEDNLGIGGYDRVMGPNGQAQYWARDLPDACRVLLRHYDHTYVVPGERFPRRAATTDPLERDVRSFPHGGSEPGSFATVGDVFSAGANPGRKQPFEIRKVMAACADQDHPPLERWSGMRDAEVAVVWDAHLGGYPVLMLGFESRPLPRIGFVANDGPEQWTSGTLFPMASKKIARAINAASGNRPLVVLANLSGFDGSPESMRKLQLEYGAEIGRAVVNFRGPIVFTVVSRYHGGAFVVFSKTLNDNMEVAALEGTYASVIGGAPAAAVVFAREVDLRTRRDPRVAALEKEVAAAAEGERRPLRRRLSDLARAVRSEKLGEVAEEFDAIHSVQRARDVGSLDLILPPGRLRPYLVEAIERGMERELGRERGGA